MEVSFSAWFRATSWLFFAGLLQAVEEAWGSFGLWFQVESLRGWGRSGYLATLYSFRASPSWYGRPVFCFLFSPQAHYFALFCCDGYGYPLQFCFLQKYFGDYIPSLSAQFMGFTEILLLKYLSL